MVLLTLLRPLFIDLKRINPRQISLIITFLCSLQVQTHAQAPNLQLNYFSNNNGIFDSDVNDIVQDTTGFIWVATQNGLYKYDGYGFKAYFSEEKDSCSLPGNFINQLFIDSKGHLWVSTKAGLCHYNQERDNFQNSPAFREQIQAIGPSVNHIVEDLNGNLLISNYQAIYRFDEEANKFSTVLVLKEGQVNHFLIDKKNNIWIACSDHQGLLKFNLNDEKWMPLPASGKNDTLLESCTISKLALTNDQLWIAILGDGIARLNIKTGELTHFPSQNQDEAMAVNVYIDHDENIWTVDYTGLKFFDKKTATFFAYYPALNDPHSIKGAVNGIFQDKQGNFWIYHHPGGVGISMKMKGFNESGFDLGYYTQTPNNNVLSICEDAKGLLWVGKAEGGVYVINRKNQTSTFYESDQNDPFSLGRGATMVIFRDSRGTMWVGNYFGGLQYFDESNHRFIGYSNSPGDPGSIAENDIRSVAEDKQGNLWLAVHGKGVDLFDRTQNRFIHYNNAQNKLSNDWTYQVLIDYKGDLWVATAWGLNHLRKGKKIFDSYYSQPGDSTSLSNNRITVLYEDENQVLWVGTSSGLDRFNAETNNFTRFENGFANKYVTAILGDQNHHLWISNQSGLARFNTLTDEVKNFNSIDGLKSNEYSEQAAYKDANNHLYYGGTEGIDVFDPLNLHFNTQPPVVLIDKIKIFNRELIDAEGKKKLEKKMGYPKKLTLNYSDNVITISYKALNFINPQKNQYAYKLEGFDKDWNYIGTAREATYTNLNPGRYIFKVMASNNDGVWNKKGAELIVEVDPPWYGTIAFKLILTLLIVGAVSGFLRYRTNQLQKQTVRLEKIVAEKTSELLEKNKLLKLQTNNLNEANQELKKLNITKDKLFSIIAHDLSNPFNTIIGFSEILKTQFTTLPDEDKKTFAQNIYSSSEKVFALLQNLLIWARSQTNRIQCHPKNIHIKQLIDEAIGLNKENLEEKDIAVTVECDEETDIWADVEMVRTILRNLLNNAIKYTPKKGKINFRAAEAGDMMQISITDSGMGMNQEKIDKLLSPNIVSSERGTGGETGSGLGLMICKDFIQMSKGKLIISSTVGKGSTFTVVLPKPKIQKT